MQKEPSLLILVRDGSFVTLHVFCHDRNRTALCAAETEVIFYERRKRINRDLLREIGYYLLTTVLAVFLAACAVFFFGFRITVIGPSMEPTLSGGQSVFVNRISTRMGIIHRGTVIAFYPGGNHSAHPYIKRVEGLPGDTVEIRDGILLINGEPSEDRARFDLIEDPGEVSSAITLGDREYFVIGDNRNNSEDSRSAGIGNVTQDMMIGVVWLGLPEGKQGFSFVH